MELSSGNRLLLSTTRASQFALRAARATESMLISASAFALTLACAVYSSGETVGAQELVVAVVCAGLAAATWWWPRRLGEPAVAKRLDRKLNLDGAYLTAWEVESGRLESTPLSRLLAARISARVQGSHVVRTTLPNSTPWIAAPFVAAALLALALAEVRSEHESSNATAATGAVVDVLSGLRSEAAREGNLSQEDLSELGELLQEARALAAMDSSELADSDGRMTELEKDLERLAAESPVDSALRQGLQESQVFVDQARMTLAETPSAPETGEVSPKPAASPGSEVASGAEPGTMSGSPSGEVGPTVGSSNRTTLTASEDAPNSAGVFSRGRWWPARHNELVSNWVEARRELD